MKTCFRCGHNKPLDEFYKHSQMADGHLNKCKSCTKVDSTANRDKNIERVREYDRQRSKGAKRVAAIAANTRAYRERYKRRMACNNAVARAVRSGKLVKLPCYVCGSDHVEGHHPDYDAPLDVVWLCPAHHKEIHLKHPRDA